MPHFKLEGIHSAWGKALFSLLLEISREPKNSSYTLADCLLVQHLKQPQSTRQSITTFKGDRDFTPIFSPSVYPSQELSIVTHGY